MISLSRRIRLPPTSAAGLSDVVGRAMYARGKHVYMVITHAFSEWKPWNFTKKNVKVRVAPLATSIAHVPRYPINKYTPLSSQPASACAPIDMADMNTCSDAHAPSRIWMSSSSSSCSAFRPCTLATRPSGRRSKVWPPPPPPPPPPVPSTRGTWHT